MAVTPTNGYATGAEVKSALNIESADTTEDPAIERAIDAASRAIDQWCGQVFYAADTLTNYYTPEDSRILRLTGPPVATSVRSIDSITVDRTSNGTYGETVPASRYWLGPRSYGAQGWPYTQVQLDHIARPWPGWVDSVKIVGDFGWASIPDPVIESCIRMSTLIFQSVSEGAAPTYTFGDEVPRPSRFLDGAVQQWLSPYRRFHPVV